jgi:hypothetical protein
MNKLRISALHDEAGKFSHETVTNIGLRRPADDDAPEPRRGGVLIGVATGLLFLLGAGLLAVSLAAQYSYVYAQRHQGAASLIEALALDLAMLITSLLALGLARSGKSAKVERGLIIIFAAGSAAMNYAAANVASPRSVAAYVVPPLLLAVIADRVVSVVRRHYLHDEETRSAWAALGTAAVRAVRVAGLLALYGLRFTLDLKGTARGLRAWVLAATPVPALPAEPLAIAAPERVTCPSCSHAATLDADGKIIGHRSPNGAYCLGFPVIMLPPPSPPDRQRKPDQDRETRRRQPRQPRAPRVTKAATLVRLVTETHGPLADIAVRDASKIATALAPEVPMHPAAARSLLVRLVRDAQAAKPVSEEASA